MYLNNIKTITETNIYIINYMSLKHTIDDEWEHFMSSSNRHVNNAESDNSDEEIDDIEENELTCDLLNFDMNNESTVTPTSSDIYISTKTKIAYLNSFIDLKDIFWKIPVILYSTPKTGVIKKQMKFNSISIDELNCVQEKLKNEVFVEEHIITSINNPTGRIKFKDIRKISIGISRKDIMSYRCKKKSAFYNCFVIIIRLKIADTFKEFHVKVFNTGKLEIPGIQNEEHFNKVLETVLEILQPHVDSKLDYKENSTETVLINSNFNCGFFVNREVLFDILKLKYNIQAIYDPCSYPGIQCKFYYNPDIGIQTGSQISEELKTKYKNIKEVSFMIFRTGSVLIVGKCDENVLILIYEFLKNILIAEYKNISQNNNNIPCETLKDKLKRKKIRRKTITISQTK
jgi:TATA-box binding protein (TBP) (component of TFIID and TFIIIB)